VALAQVDCQPEYSSGTFCAPKRGILLASKSDFVPCILLRKCESVPFGTHQKLLKPALPILLLSLLSAQTAYQQLDRPSKLRSSTGRGSNQYEHTAESDAKSHGVVGEQLFTHGQIILRRTFRLDDAHIGRSLGLRMDES
jgi:hypothetical protein